MINMKKSKILALTLIISAVIGLSACGKESADNGFEAVTEIQQDTTEAVSEDKDGNENSEAVSENTTAAYKAYLAELEDNYEDYSVVVSGYPLSEGSQDIRHKTVAIGDFWGDGVPEMVAVKRSKITFTDENNNPTAWNADVFVWSYNPDTDP